MIDIEIYCPAMDIACPITDDEYMQLLAEDVDVLDTTPEDALKGTVRYMPGLATDAIAFGSEPATEQILTLPILAVVAQPGESIVVGRECLYSG